MFRPAIVLRAIQKRIQSINYSTKPNFTPLGANWTMSSPPPRDTAPVESKKRPPPSNNQSRNKKQKKAEKPAREGGSEEVLLFDVQELLKKFSLNIAPPADTEANAFKLLPQLQSELELTVHEISSTGDALALDSSSNHVYVVPFAVPGDKITAKVFKHFEKQNYSLTDLIKVERPSEKRDDSLVRCQYFASCSGCQFQMLSYPDQLAHKKRIVEKAYKNFSLLDPKLVPMVADTIGSPLEYGYRTKLTPHFDGPPGGRRDRRNNTKPSWPAVPPIGFMKKGTRKTLDIEDCPIGTDAVRMGMKREKARVTKEIDTYHRGATILLRESTERIPKSESENEKQDAKDTIYEDRGEYIHAKTCITDQTAISTEFIDDFTFQNPAGSFFQNNNSILPKFTSYVREHILPPKSSGRKITNLIDAYSGSGLFTITLASLFKKSIGIDISPSSIASASQNAKLNNLPEEQASFMAADARDLFKSVEFDASETVVVIDPPRKGCDENFLKQLLKFGPERVVYVSCNVHTQARDVGMLVNGMKNVDAGMGVGEGAYEIESLVGFDFFPQTGHVEGVAVLNKKKIVDAEMETEE
jgi:tRNA (uracil-5-)-methyltransferase